MRTAAAAQGFGWHRYIRHACLRKRAWQAKDQAESAGRKTMAEGAPQLYVYHCPHCRFWHLTRKNYGTHEVVAIQESGR